MSGLLALSSLLTLSSCSDAIPYSNVAGTSTTTTTTAYTTINSFSFSDQTATNLNQQVTSAPVTVSGFTGILPGACTGCAAIIRNGVTGSSTGSFLPGDSISLVMLTSPNPNTTTTATLTIGATTSSVWSVTTSNDAPNAFSFTNQTGAQTGIPIVSNTVTLAGTFAAKTATCNTGCIGISRNGNAYSTSVSGFVPGDTITIKQTSSASVNTTTTASVTIGATTSSAWTVKTIISDACVGSPAIGTLCADGTVYAGLSPDGNVPFYTTPCDAGLAFDGTSCTGTSIQRPYSTGASITTTIATTTGKANTAALYAANGNADGPYGAATFCVGLNANGHMDWYLPAVDEMYSMYLNKTAIGNYDISGTWYWTSTEYTSGACNSATECAYHMDMSSGSRSNGGSNSSNSKLSVRVLRCARHN